MSLAFTSTSSVLLRDARLLRRSDRLTAPSLSFDWQEPEEPEEDDRCVLQVEAPERAKTAEGRRALLREEMRRAELKKSMSAVGHLLISKDFCMFFDVF